MACQTPVIGVREAGVRESVIDGQTGLLVDREPEAMAGAIRMLLADPEEADRLGCNARSNVEKRWTWAASIEMIEHYLADTVQLKDSGRSV